MFMERTNKEQTMIDLTDANDRPAYPDILDPHVQEDLRALEYEPTDLERDAEQADALGVTLEEYRASKRFFSEQPSGELLDDRDEPEQPSRFQSPTDQVRANGKLVDVNIQPEGFFFRGADFELYYARFAYDEILGHVWAVDHMKLTRCYMGLSK